MNHPIDFIPFPEPDSGASPSLASRQRIVRNYSLPGSAGTLCPAFIRFPALARAAWVLICAGAVLAGTGCGLLGPSIAGSGHTVTKEYDLSGFSKLAVGHAFQVDVTQGPKHSVALTVDDNLVEYLDVTTSGETLRIKFQPNLSVRSATLKAAVVMPELTGLDLSGAVRATVAGFSSEKSLDAELSGASNLRGDIKNGDARFDLSGASRVGLRGSAGTLRITASGASKADLEEYRSGQTSVNASGASKVNISPSGHLEAEASGASTVTYGGEPDDVKANTSGASSVRKR